ARKGSGGSARASWVSIQSRWSSAQASAARRPVRHGQVSLSMPAASSNRRRKRRVLRSRRISFGTGMEASSETSERPYNHMIFELARLFLAQRPSARRLPRLVHRLAASRDQIMPVRKRLARRAQPVCAGLRQPVERAEIGPVELHAVGHAFHAILVVEAAAVPAV